MKVRKMVMKRWMSLVLILATSGLPAFSQEAPNPVPPEIGRMRPKIPSRYSDAQHEQEQRLIREGEAYFAQKRWREAEKAYEGALEAIYSPGVAVYYARALEMQGKEQQALLTYRKLFSIGTVDYNDGNPLISYAQLATKFGFGEEAAGAYRRVIRETEGTLDEAQRYLNNRPDLRRLRTVALVAAGQKTTGNKELRLRYYRDAVATDAHYPPAQLALGKALAYSGKAQDRVEARKRLQEAARLGTGTVRKQAEEELKKLP